MNHKRLAGAIALATMMSVLTVAAFACGDKLVALGGGVGFQRIMMSRHPGRIALLAEPATGLAVANDRFDLAASLTLAGHEVRVLKSVKELSAVADMPAPDVILVDASRVRELQLQPTTTGAAPTILPVAY